MPPHPLAGRAYLWHPREYASCGPGQNHRTVLILLSKPTDFLNQNVGKYADRCRFVKCVMSGDPVDASGYYSNIL